MSGMITPGPWKFDETWRLIIGPKGEEVAAIHSGIPEDGSRRVNRNVAIANGELIASAPDLLRQRDALLEACKWWFEDAEMRSKANQNEPRYNTPGFLTQMARCRAAIALCEKEGV